MFAYDCFVRNGESVTSIRREFCYRFNINRNDSVPVRDTILCWVKKSKKIGAILKNKSPGPQHRVRTPENFQSDKRYCAAQAALLEDIQLLLESAIVR